MYKATVKVTAGLMSTVFFVGILCGTAESSTLRVRSMGGVSICTRDVNSDPLTFNPARAAIIRKPVIVGGLDYTPYDYAYNEKDSLPRYGGVTGNAREEKRKSRALALDLLGYYPLKTATAGIYSRYTTISDEQIRSVNYFGKVDTNIVYSTSTAEELRTANRNVRALHIGALGGMKIGTVYAGLQYEKDVPYTQTAVNSRTVSDRSFFGEDIEERSNSQKEDTQYFGDTFKGGALFFPFENTSVDLTVSPSVSIVESRVTDEWTDGVQTWQDDRDAFPILRRRTTDTSWQTVMRHTSANNMVYGLLLGYSEGSVNEELKRSSYTYTNNAEDNRAFNISAGIGFQMEQDFTGELDLEYSRALITASNYGWTGTTTERASINDATNDSMLVRAGFEKWIFNNTFALRAGGGIYCYNYTNTTYTDLTLNRTISDDGRSTGINSSFYSFGFGWVLSNSILLEYGARGDSRIDHNVAMTYTF